MSHLGDTNKMVGDTPRTDARRGFHGWYTAVDAEFSEKLERELNAANAEVDRLTAKVAQLYEGAEEQKQRIKRLKEALSQIANQDYRGNRSTESQIAFEALKGAKL